MFCSKCGKKLPENAIFCSGCGNKIINRKKEEVVVDDKSVQARVTLMDETVLINSEETELDEVTEIIENISDEQDNLFSRDSFFEQDSIISEEEFDTDEINEDRMKPDKNKLGIIILVCVMFILLIVAIVIFFILGSMDKETVADKDISEEIQTEEASSEEIGEVSKEELLEIAINEIVVLVETGQLEDALAQIGEQKVLNEECDELYLYEADVYLKQNNYDKAVATLDEGIAKNGSETLINRKKYICNNIVQVSMEPTDGGVGIYNEYNNAGNLIREELYDSEFDATGWNEYEYDLQGFLQSCSSYNVNGNLEKYTQYIYDEAGVLYASEEYNVKQVMQARHEYLYDSLGRESEVLNYGKNNKLAWKTKREYDTFGRLVRNTGYDAKNRAQGWVDTTYDGKGNIVMMARYDSKGKIVEWNETKYDENGRPTQSINYSKKNTVVGSIEYIYDADGRKIKEVYYDKKGNEEGYAEFDIAEKKVLEQNKDTGILWQYKYMYVGDVLCDKKITPLTGTLSFVNTVGYKRLPLSEAAYVNKTTKDSTYQVIGETEEYYKVLQGWYFYKQDNGIIYKE